MSESLHGSPQMPIPVETIWVVPIRQQIRGDTLPPKTHSMEDGEINVFDLLVGVHASGFT